MKLGDIIQEIDIRNNFNKLSLSSVRGVSIDKKFILTKANMEGVSLSGYKIVNSLCICYVPVTSRNGEKISLALNESDEDYIVSSTYVVLKSKNDKLIYMPFLNIYMRRSEFDRLSRFNSWGSARETLNTSELYEFKISLPSIKIQHQYADAYNSLKKLAEQNEAMIKPLQEFCTGFMAKMIKEYRMEKLGSFIEEINSRNENNCFGVDSLMGVCCDGIFINTIAKTQGLSLKNYKIVNTGAFAYSNRINVGSIALNKNKDCIISPSYSVFKIKDEKRSELMEDYLNIFFHRSEFLRQTLFYAYGTIKDDFKHNEMCRVKIPLPPIEVQESIVAIYKCAEKARSIAERAREEMKRICPAMIQRAAHQ